MGDVIVLGAVAVAAAFAVRYLWKARKEGRCAGCKGCSGGCSHCRHS